MTLLRDPRTGDQANHADAVRRLDAALDDQERLRAIRGAATSRENEHGAEADLSAANEQVAARRAWLNYIDHAA